MPELVCVLLSSALFNQHTQKIQHMSSTTSDPKISRSSVGVTGLNPFSTWVPPPSPSVFSKKHPHGGPTTPDARLNMISLLTNVVGHPDASTTSHQTQRLRSPSPSSAAFQFSLPAQGPFIKNFADSTAAQSQPHCSGSFVLHAHVNNFHRRAPSPLSLQPICPSDSQTTSTTEMTHESDSISAVDTVRPFIQKQSDVVAVDEADTRWVCTVCFSVKPEIRGPHLNGKRKVRSDCWPCGIKRTFARVRIDGGLSQGAAEVVVPSGFSSVVNSDMGLGMGFPSLGSFSTIEKSGVRDYTLLRGSDNIDEHERRKREQAEVEIRAAIVETEVNDRLSLMNRCLAILAVQASMSK